MEPWKYLGSFTFKVYDFEPFDKVTWVTAIFFIKHQIIPDPNIKTFLLKKGLKTGPKIVTCTRPG